MAAGGHCNDYVGRRSRLRCCRLCERSNPGEYLPLTKTALTGKALPITASELLGAGVAGNLLGQILCDVVPYLTAHDIIERRQRGATGIDHDRIIFGMRIGIADDD